MPQRVAFAGMPSHNSNNMADFYKHVQISLFSIQFMDNDDRNLHTNDEDYEDEDKIELPKNLFATIRHSYHMFIMSLLFC